MNEKRLIRIAKIVSAVFSPFYLTLWVITCLLAYNYMKFASWGYRMPLMAYLLLFAIVLFFTVLIPLTSIGVYRRLCKLTGWDMSRRRYRYIPYIITIVCYWFCMLFMRNMHAPASLHGIVMAAFAIQVVCAFINMFWKISVHMAGVGALVGFVIAFSLIFNFSPLWYLCVFLLVAGIVGTSRMVLRQHSLSQVVVGFLVGLVCSFYFVI